MATPDLTRNREMQAELYGEPLGDVITRVTRGLGLSQARLAEVLGLSPAMLSQLVTAHRVKIGNPAVVERLRALDELESEAGTLSADDLQTRLSGVRALSGAWSRPVAAAGGHDPRAAVRTVQALLRTVASAEQILRAADEVQAVSPELAELLRIYGAGRTDEALAHFERVQPL